MTAQTTVLRSWPPPAQAFDVALLDLDGVVYVGPDAVPGATAAIAAAAQRDLHSVYVTNNASRPPRVVARQLRSLGIPADDADVVTSAQLAAGILAARLPRAAAVLVVGGPGLHEALTEEGLRPVTSMDADPQAVVQGFGPDVGWRDLAEGARAVRAGLFWVATNLDLTVPTQHGPAPGNGTLVAAIATAAANQYYSTGSAAPRVTIGPAQQVQRRTRAGATLHGVLLRAIATQRADPCLASQGEILVFVLQFPDHDGVLLVNADVAGGPTSPAPATDRELRTIVGTAGPTT